MSTPTETHNEVRTGRARARMRAITLVHGRGGGPIALDGQRVVIGREPGPGGLALDDGRASRAHCELVFSPAFGVYRVRDLGSKNGTLLGGKTIEAEHLPSGSVLRVGDSLLVYSEVDALDGLPPLPPVGGSLALARAQHLADLVAPSTLPVLLSGPTGSGKEVLAQRIHAASGRSGRMVALNCATFSPELLASELFGHARGAFSGARDARSGLLVEASGGTLFLDEIAELPLAQQPALLRALQEQRVRPVGANHEVPIDVRLVAATHADLDRMQAEGRFRADLYARLAGLVIDLPGLTERREEILCLFKHFLEVERPIDLEVAERLLLHDWPHGIRELQHVARSVRLFAERASRVHVDLLPARLHLPEASPGPSIEQLLALHGGNVSQVAAALGETRQKVYRMLRAQGLDPERFRE